MKKRLLLKRKRETKAQSQVGSVATKKKGKSKVSEFHLSYGLSPHAKTLSKISESFKVTWGIESLTDKDKSDHSLENALQKLQYILPADIFRDTMSKSFIVGLSKFPVTEIQTQDTLYRPAHPPTYFTANLSLFLQHNISVQGLILGNQDESCFSVHTPRQWKYLCQGLRTTHAPINFISLQGLEMKDHECMELIKIIQNNEYLQNVKLDLFNNVFSEKILKIQVTDRKKFKQIRFGYRS